MWPSGSVSAPDGESELIRMIFWSRCFHVRIRTVTPGRKRNGSLVASVTNISVSEHMSTSIVTDLSGFVLSISCSSCRFIWKGGSGGYRYPKTGDVSAPVTWFSITLNVPRSKIGVKSAAAAADFRQTPTLFWKIYSFRNCSGSENGTAFGSCHLGQHCFWLYPGSGWRHPDPYGYKLQPALRKCQHYSDKYMRFRNCSGSENRNRIRLLLLRSA